LEKQWEQIKTDMEVVNRRGQKIHLKNVPAFKNKKTGTVGVYPAEVAKAEMGVLAEQYGLEPRDIPLLLMLQARPGPFQEGYVQYKYQLNKMLFYQWKEMEKKGLGEAFPHDEFEAAPRGPVPRNLGKDLERLAEKCIVSLSYKKWGKGKGEASLTSTLTPSGINIATRLAGEAPEPLREITTRVKQELFPLDPQMICEKVHKEFPEYRKIYKKLDTD